MSNVVSEHRPSSNSITSTFTEEFEKYLKKQSLKATFIQLVQKNAWNWLLIKKVS